MVGTCYENHLRFFFFFLLYPKTEKKNNKIKKLIHFLKEKQPREKEG